MLKNRCLCPTAAGMGMFLKSDTTKLTLTSPTACLKLSDVFFGAQTCRMDPYRYIFNAYVLACLGNCVLLPGKSPLHVECRKSPLHADVNLSTERSDATPTFGRGKIIMNDTSVMRTY